MLSKWQPLTLKEFSSLYIHSITTLYHQPRITLSTLSLSKVIKNINITISAVLKMCSSPICKGNCRYQIRLSHALIIYDQMERAEVWKWFNGVLRIIFVIGSNVSCPEACEYILRTIAIDLHVDMVRIGLQTHQKCMYHYAWWIISLRLKWKHTRAFCRAFMRPVSNRGNSFSSHHLWLM